MALLNQEDMYTKQNVPKTTSLVLETSRPGDKPIFTVSFVRDDYISLSKLFVELTVDDPTETAFAEHVFGSLHFWMNMREANRLKPYVEQWREIADCKRKQTAFKALIEEVRSSGRSNVSAARYLIEEPWKGNTKKAREASKKTTQKAYTNIKDDIERVKEFLQ